MPAPDDPGSVSHWIDALKAGNRDAVQPLWNRYFERLVRLARGKLRSVRRADSDEEDAALSAFESFCAGVDGGRFPVLTDRADLWRLLVKITARKAYDRIQYQRTKGRDSRRTVDEAALAGMAADGGGLQWLVGAEPTPEFAAMVADECRALLDALGDETLCQIALLKMEGYTAPEIAERIDLCERTIANKLKLIRMIWSQDRLHV